MSYPVARVKSQVLILILFSVFFLSSAAFAQEPGGKITAAEQAAGENVTLDFKDADIKSVLKIISYKSGVNIVATPEVMGTVTIRLENVPWEQALDTIVRTYGFAYEWISSKVIMVSTLEKLAEQRKVQEEAAAKEPLDTQTFVLNFTKAEDVKIAVEKLVSERGKITLEPRTNTLIIMDTKSNLIKIGQIIKGLDKITPQVMIEAKIIETTLGDLEKLGIDWTMKVTAKGAKRPTTFPFKRWDSGGDMYPVPEYEASFDDEGRETVTSAFPKRGGIMFPADHWSLGSFPMAGAGEFLFGTLDFSQFQAVLEILNSRTDTNIISNPRITTLNNQEAKIIVGTIVPIPLYEYSTDTGTRIISGYENQKIGVQLVVTPNINEQKYITLDVVPSVDEITGWTGPDNERPIISTRSATTKVMIKDGQTLVIGGKR